MNAKNVDRIMHANTSMIRAYSKDSLIWGEEIPKYHVRVIVSIPSNVGGRISVWVNDEDRPREIKENKLDVFLNQGDVVKVKYRLRSSGYYFYSNTVGIIDGVVIDKDYDIIVGFKRTGEIA